MASGAWPQPDAPEAARFATLQDHYRTLAQREKLEKENRRFYGRKLSYMQLTDKYGLSAAVARRRAGLPPLHSLTGKSTSQEVNGQVPLGNHGGQKFYCIVRSILKEITIFKKSKLLLILQNLIKNTRNFESGFFFDEWASPPFFLIVI